MSTTLWPRLAAETLLPPAEPLEVIMARDTIPAPPAVECAVCAEPGGCICTDSYLAVQKGSLAELGITHDTEPCPPPEAGPAPDLGWDEYEPNTYGGE